MSIFMPRHGLDNFVANIKQQVDTPEQGRRIMFSPYGKLYERLKLKGRFSEKVSAMFILDLALALNSSHDDKHVIHETIKKPKNLLIGTY
jgi:hypothetical protein